MTRSDAPSNDAASPPDLRDVDTVLTTTRAVRRRLDLDREVDAQLVHECLELALQAPTGAGSEPWRWVLVRDADQRAAIGAEYLRIFDAHVRPTLTPERVRGKERMYEGAVRLAENLHRVPWLTIVCTTQRSSDPALQAPIYGSVFPAIWSYQLALRSRGLGSTITTLHLREPEGVARILDLPEQLTQVALLPVAHTVGLEFGRGRRRAVAEVASLDRWGAPFSPPSTW